MFSTADWAAPYWTNKQHVADRLAKAGHRVLYIESPGIRPPQGNARDILRIANRLKRAWTPPKPINDNLWVFAPLTIPLGHRFALVKRFNAWLMRSVVGRWLDSHRQGDVIVWTYHPYIEGVTEGLSTGSLVYHCVDDLAAIPGVDAATFRAAEGKLVRQAAVVFTTSPYLRRHCLELGAQNCVFERNVADIEHFSAARQSGRLPEDIASIAGPKLCYLGVLSDYKLDLDLIEACGRARPDLSWIFIGDEPERQANATIARLKTLPNMHFIGYRPYSELPDYLRAIDIAVLPNRTDGYMRGVFPMKFYEYLAAGKPVISTPIDALVDVSNLVATAEGRDQWLAAIDECLSSPPGELSLDDSRLAQFGWDPRLERMLATVGDVQADRSVSI
ncbi:glycosyl transferase [Rhizobium sp. ACO-34A]|nr:glycosyl transferase [Rhizobium sp. ACO-34A]